MKIRIQADTVRYRLNRKEVELLAQSGRCESAIRFAAGPLRYAVEASEDAARPEAVYEPGLILVRVPAAVARTWAVGDDVAITGTQDLDAGNHLEILIEKDFQCLHKGDEAKDPDAFPNPDEVRA